SDLNHNPMLISFWDARDSVRDSAIFPLLGAEGELDTFEWEKIKHLFPYNFPLLSRPRPGIPLAFPRTLGFNAAMPIEESEVSAHAAKVRQLLAALNEPLYGQEALVELVVTGLLSRGHILLEGLPGLGKTELVKALAKTLDLEN